MTKHWNYDEARGLKAIGTTWEEIARIYGITTYRARTRLDPEWGKAKRARVHELQREYTRSLGKRDHVQHVKPEPIKAGGRDDGPFMTASGIMAYRKEIPNRISLTSQPVYEATATKVVTLPWVSILGDRSLHHREG